MIIIYKRVVVVILLITMVVLVLHFKKNNTITKDISFNTIETFKTSNDRYYSNIDSIFIEQPQSLESSEKFFFNYDNKIFRTGKIFFFSAKYIPNNTNPELLDFYTKTLNFSVEAFDSEIMVKKNQYQTPLKYFIESIKKESISGVIENDKNVWLHPPRDGLFKILELNPYPYIKYPFKIGNKWSWHLKIGESWSDKRWRTWNGVINNKCDYEITEIKTIKTNFGNLDCFVVESEAVSEIGMSKLQTFFNKDYGFVQMNFQNIDKSQWVIVLESVSYKPSQLFNQLPL